MDKLKDITCIYGLENTVCQAAEELAELSESCIELSQACNRAVKSMLKLRRVNNGTTPVTIHEALQHVHEELADVMICMEALESTGQIDAERVHDIKEKKTDRWYRRVVLDQMD